MISVEEAKIILQNNISPIQKITNVNVGDAIGMRLAEDIFAPLNLPPFNQSNVDGYAVKLSQGAVLKVVSEIKAGDAVASALNEGEASRIFTGAMVPAGSDCVIMQEKIERDGNSLRFNYAEVNNGDHIRTEGSQIKKGELAVKSGTVITPATIGFLCDLGISEIHVFRKPKVALIVTGNELQSTGKPLEKGKIYESNSTSLKSALVSCGIIPEKILFVKDDKVELEKTVVEALVNTDVLLISGGISVGDYDFVHEVLKNSGTQTLFYKIAQKPGKPLYFGKNASTFVFGLPGNPASALTCFYEYIYPAIRKLQGRENYFLKKFQLPALKAIQKKSGLAHFLRAVANENGVMPLTGQESFKMRAFTESNAFIYLSNEKENVAVGELVEVHLLPEY